MMPEAISTPDTNPEEMVTILKALADPNRLRIFEALMRGASCNGWLTEELGEMPNLLSHHLKVLDESFPTGGTLAKAAAEGKRVHLVTATRSAKHKTN